MRWREARCWPKVGRHTVHDDDVGAKLDVDPQQHRKDHVVKGEVALGRHATKVVVRRLEGYDDAVREATNERKARKRDHEDVADAVEQDERRQRQRS